MNNIDVVAPIIIGCFFGIIISTLFVKYGYVSNVYTVKIFDTDSNIIISGLLLFGLFIGISILAGLSVIVYDTAFIQKEPLKFIFEMILMALLPTLSFLFVIFIRKNRVTERNNLELFLLGIKFALFHLLFQLSGYYRHIFE
jgi:hypothetical protein